MPDEVRGQLRTDLEPYRRAFPRVRWLAPETWHLTLVFLGSVSATAVVDLQSACDLVATAWPPFAIDLRAGGGRVQGHDGVAWLSVGMHARRVIEVADDLKRVIERDVGRVPELRRAVSAHLTVARRVDERLVAALHAEALGPLRAGWSADRIALMRSHLGRSGASYERIHEAPSRGAPER